MTPPSIKELFDPQGNETRALLLHLATMAEIPTSVMDWLIENQAIASLRNLSIIPLDDIVKYQGEYQANTPMNVSPWTSTVSCHLRSLNKWLLAYHHTFGGYPHPSIMTKDDYELPIGLLRF